MLDERKGHPATRTVLYIWCFIDLALVLLTVGGWILTSR